MQMHPSHQNWEMARGKSHPRRRAPFPSHLCLLLPQAPWRRGTGLPGCFLQGVAYPPNFANYTTHLEDKSETFRHMFKILLYNSPSCLPHLSAVRSGFPLHRRDHKLLNTQEQERLEHIRRFYLGQLNFPSSDKNPSFSGKDYPVWRKKDFGRVTPKLIRSEGLL